ncbi:MAG: hypothetical protein IJO11_03110 [Alphaproteobacteria bacterium]|nr:hypothetical protein [Alphaproteobacteria bacterium]MBQ8557309.1 hypothetical protein [Alphaproteobacteria bacterium]MBR3913493.1 hypothetical protein [Alphaproteobacteria bacterium]
MKKILALTIACSVLSGCSYLGEPEAYTVVEEETAPIATPAPVTTPAPVVYAQPTCGMSHCGMPRCGCSQGACQINPGIAGPLVITIPEQSVCVQ